jgi:hypothetical protein
MPDPNVPNKPIDPADAEAIREISFGKAPVDPDDFKAYQEKIAAARARAPNVNSLKSKTPVGVIPRPSIPPLVRPQAGGPSGLTEEGGVAPRPPGSPVLSQETAEALAALGEASKSAAADAKKAEEAKKEEEGKTAVEDLFSEFSFGSQNEAERLLNNKKRRDEIEARCQPMDFEDLLMKDEVTQAVPIIPGKFIPVFRSMRPEDSLFIKQYLAKDSVVSDTYSMEKLVLCQLACALVSLNGKDLPDYRKGQDQSPDEELFKAKLKILTRKSAYIIADLCLNYQWFDIRVRKLIVPEKLGNG